MIKKLTPKEKWNSIEKENQDKLLNNVWCNNCKCTKIIDYKIYSNKCGIILRGKCAKCDGEVARVIEGI